MNQNMKRNLFEESEVPYQTLAKFGLTHEMIEDLPMHALEDINNGRPSPVLPVSMEVHTVLDSLHHLAEVNILVTTNLAVLIQELLCDVTLCQLEVTCTLSYSTVESTSL